MNELLVVIILILVGGFFAASEMALITVKRHRLSQLADDGNRSAQLARRLTEDPSRFLATIQIAITFLGFLSGAVGAAAFSQHARSADPVDTDHAHPGGGRIDRVRARHARHRAGLDHRGGAGAEDAGAQLPGTAGPARITADLLPPGVPVADRVVRLPRERGPRPPARRQGAAAGRLPVDRGAQAACRDRLGAGRHRGGGEGDDPRGHRARGQARPRGHGPAHRHSRRQRRRPARRGARHDRGRRPLAPAGLRREPRQHRRRFSTPRTCFRISRATGARTDRSTSASSSVRRCTSPSRSRSTTCCTRCRPPSATSPSSSTSTAAPPAW